jgi:hypothetical protein
MKMKIVGWAGAHDEHGAFIQLGDDERIRFRTPPIYDFGNNLGEGNNNWSEYQKFAHDLVDRWNSQED